VRIVSHNPCLATLVLVLLAGPAHGKEIIDLDADRHAFTPTTATVDVDRLLAETASTFIDHREGLGERLSAETSISGLKARIAGQAEWMPRSIVIMEVFAFVGGDLRGTEPVASIVWGWECPEHWRFDATFRDVDADTVCSLRVQRTTGHQSASSLRVSPARGRQKSPRGARRRPMLVERSPTPEPTFPGLPDRRYSEPAWAVRPGRGACRASRAAGAPASSKATCCTAPSTGRRETIRPARCRSRTPRASSSRSP
jgi:hypothetical protein